MNDLPDGFIDWNEISGFVEDMLCSQNRLEKGWKIINDKSATSNLQENSVIVLHTLYDDLYEYFYKLHDDRNDVWNRMELHIRTKYAELSEKALSRIISAYHIDDR